MIKNATGKWLEKSCKFAMREETKEVQKPINAYVQWMSGDNKTFCPASRVIKELPPGYYSIGMTMDGQVFFTAQNPHTEKLIKFPETTSDMVVAEIEKFWDKENTYKENGLSYRRGIILYGKPGGGKTSTIKLTIKNLIERKGIVLDFGAAHSFRAGLSVLREIQPDTPVIVLMEDIDAILNGYNESEVLNILDGVVPIHKCLFLATTNYPERLGARIMNRPSRFDKRFEIGMPNPESRKIYLKSISNGELKGDEIKKWVEDTDGLAIAHLKELFVSVKILGYKYADAIDALKGLSTKLYSDEYTEGTLPVKG